MSSTRVWICACFFTAESPGPRTVPGTQQVLDKYWLSPCTNEQMKFSLWDPSYPLCFYGTPVTAFAPSMYSLLLSQQTTCWSLELLYMLTCLHLFFFACYPNPPTLSLFQLQFHFLLETLANPRPLCYPVGSVIGLLLWTPVLSPCSRVDKLLPFIESLLCAGHMVLTCIISLYHYNNR